MLLSVDQNFDPAPQTTPLVVEKKIRLYALSLLLIGAESGRFWLKYNHSGEPQQGNNRRLHKASHFKTEYERAN